MYGAGTKGTELASYSFEVIYVFDRNHQFSLGNSVSAEGLRLQIISSLTHEPKSDTGGKLQL